MPEPQPVQKSRSRILSVSFLIVGLGLFCGLIYKMEPQKIWSYLQIVRWNFTWIILLGVGILIFFAIGWNEFLRGIKSKVPLWKLFMTKAAGEATNNMTPVSWGGGDAMRIYLLSRSVPVNLATASVVVDRTLNSIVLILLVLVGVLTALFQLNLTLNVKIFFLGFVAFSIGMAFYWYRKQQEGLFQFFAQLLKKLRLKKNWSEESLQRLRDIDQLISQFYQKNQTGFFISLLFQVLARLSEVIEVYLICFFFNQPLDWMTCFWLMTLTPVITMVSIFIPGGLGVLEGAYGAFFHFIGKDPVFGVSIQLVRRAKILVFTLFGLIYINLSRLTSSSA